MGDVAGVRCFWPAYRGVRALRFPPLAGGGRTAASSSAGSGVGLSRDGLGGSGDRRARLACATCRPLRRPCRRRGGGGRCGLPRLRGTAVSSTALQAASLNQHREVRLSHLTLLTVFLRSLFLQASWNPQGMQNLGLAYALFPALKELYPNQDELMAAVRRHLSFFNTHPYVAAALLGGVLHHELRSEERRV